MEADAAQAELGDVVRRRRLSLGLSAREAARRARVSRNTWTGAEEGTRRTAEHNYAGIERALRWASGSVEAVLSGEQPVVLVEQPTDDEPAGDRAVVLQVVEILGTRYSAEVKLTMIQDVIDRDFVAEPAVEDERLTA